MTNETITGAVTPGHRVDKYLSKQKINIDKHLDEVRRLKQEGPSQDVNSITVVPPSGNHLRFVVDQIDLYCRQVGPQPFPSGRGQQLSDLLIYLVETVVYDLNKDMRSDTTRPKSQDSRHNLYLWLIGKPPPETATNTFVLNLLATLPVASWYCWRERLINLRKQIGDNIKTSEEGSQRFIEQLDDMIVRIA